MNINIIYVCCLSRMMRKYHVRFLEGKAPAMGLTYSTRSSLIAVKEGLLEKRLVFNTR